MPACAVDDSMSVTIMVKTNKNILIISLLLSHPRLRPPLALSHGKSAVNDFFCSGIFLLWLGLKKTKAPKGTTVPSGALCRLFKVTLSHWSFLP
jgi:hypothetical protein